MAQNKTSSDLNHPDTFPVNFESHQIVSSKLPSKKDALSVLFYNIRVVKLTVRESANLVYDEVVLFWQKAKIPTQKKQRCVDKVENIYQQWRSMQKSGRKKNGSAYENWFLENLDDLFDIGHQNALESMSDQQDRDFLLSQRLKGRPGYMNSSRTCVIQTEKKSHKRSRNESSEHEDLIISGKRQRKTVFEKSHFDLDCEIQYAEVSSDMDSDDSGSTWEESDCEEEPSCEPKRDAKKLKFFDTRLLSTLDAQQISDRKAIHVIIAAAKALGHSIDDLTISRTTLRKLREKNRAEVALTVKNKIKVNII